MCEVSGRYGIQTHVSYNQFFHPNVCHVCKSTDPNDLMLCARCHMICYCSKEHKGQHRSHHEDICTLIAQFINEDPDWNTHRFCCEDLIKRQKSFVQIAQLALGRKLETYEVQMFMFAKMCFICHQRSNLVTCRKCISVSYCDDHASQICLHRPVCDDLALCLHLDILLLEETSWEQIHVEFSNFPDKKKPFNDMSSFYRQYHKKQSGYKDVNLNICVFTDYVSGPLTVYYGLQSANEHFLKNVTHSFIVHIIAADYVDERSLSAWELFLHLLNKKSNLTVVMVGSELRLKNYEHKVCSCCKAAKKKLILQSSPMLYHRYVRYNCKRPNVIVAFQAELDYGKSWAESIH